MGLVSDENLNCDILDMLEMFILSIDGSVRGDLQDSDTTNAFVFFWRLDGTGLDAFSG